MFIIINYGHIKIQILTLKPFSFSNLLSIWCSKNNNLALFQRICLSFCLAISTNIHSKRNFCETTVIDKAIKELMMLRYSLHIMKITEVQTKWQSVFNALIWRKYLIRKLSPFQLVKKKPVGHSIGMVWNATGSFFLSRSIRTLNMSSKQTKKQKCYFRLKTCIVQHISHPFGYTVDPNQYILQTNNFKINISIMIIM